MSIGIVFQLQLEVEVGDVTNEKTGFELELLPRNPDSRLGSLGTFSSFITEKGRAAFDLINLAVIHPKNIQK